MNFDTIGQEFVKVYYTTFDSNRANLLTLYREDSMLTFEGERLVGSQAIVAKLGSLPFQQVQHGIKSIDCQPMADSGVLVQVVGQLKINNDSPVGFSQTFHLRPNIPVGQVVSPQEVRYYVNNDIFRLV